MEKFNSNQNKPKNEGKEDIEKAPEGWKTQRSLSENLNIDRKKIKVITDNYRQSNPEYFKEFKAKNGPVREHYSPELVEKIKGNIIEYEKSMEGWMTLYFLSKDLYTAPKKIKIIAEKYRKSNPEYFKEFKAANQIVYEYLSPEIIEIIKKEINKYEKAPDDWMTSKSLAYGLDVAPKTAQNIADNYRQSNPEYFGKFKDKNGRIFEYYSPELVKIITEKINKYEKAPDGWLTNSNLSGQLNVSTGTILEIADKYIKNNPEYFKDFWVKGKIVRHYSPRLVKIIQSKIESLNKAPDGWLTNSNLSGQLNVSTGTILEIADKYRKSNPEYFKEFRMANKNLNEHYSPSFIEIVKNELNKIEKAPEGWMTNVALCEKLGLSYTTISKFADKYRKSNPEYFKEYNNQRRIFEYYSPELVKIIKTEVDKFENAPEGWMTNNSLSQKTGEVFQSLKDIAYQYKKKHPAYFKEFRNARNSVREHYSPELVKIILDKIEKNKKLSVIPEGWMNCSSLSQSLKDSPYIIAKIANKYRQSHPEYFREFRVDTGIFEYYSPELIEIVKKEINKFEKAPAGWFTKNGLANLMDISFKTTHDMLEKYRKSNPEYFKEFRSDGGIFEYYSPELVKIIKIEINKFEKAPAGWFVNKQLADYTNSTEYIIRGIAGKYRKINPEYFKKFRGKMGRIDEHYSPELVEIIKREINLIKESNLLEEKEEALKSDFENLAQEIANEETANENARKIGEIIKFLPGKAHDIIFKYHPQYKGMSIGYVKKIIAEYLGDFMVNPKPWNAGDVEKFRDLMDIENIKDEILYILKNDCLSYINSEKKNNPQTDDHELMDNYFQRKEIQALASCGVKEAENSMHELQEYYESIFALRTRKPSHIVESLKEGRVFPDINQLVNIKEIKEKNKILIADEMGLGKSASAILTKEYLRLKSALVVMPSNVEHTWQNYLSDKIDENGKQIGYFKNGQTPKILTIESPKDLEKLQSETFDYVLISQEKMSGEGYTEALKQIDFDMMIVDEVHKLKNIESGVRFEAVDELAEKIKGDGKYMALLSGTPVPDKVKDVGVILKLLYPEKYKQFSNKEIVDRIIKGDLMDLRSELLMKTQMKEIATSIEMPSLKEEVIEVRMSPTEKEVYEILLEEEEMTASDKIILFRKFLLNPELLNMEPGFKGSKVEQLEKTLNEDLKTQDKIVVFVNNYIKGVIQDKKNIIDKIDLPGDVVIERIYGDIDSPERNRIENDLKYTDKKMVVFVSGQTANVGVDFSGANGCIFYNEPWSKFDLYQERARIYREGLKNPLVSKTLITKDSIEEGINKYINAKEKAIEKLLKGISNTDAEKKLLYNDSKLNNKNIETNAELSKKYLSDYEKLLIHFGESMFAGEKKIRGSMPRTGKEYAELYRKLGRLTYQGNNARVTSTLIENMINENSQNPEDLRIVDIASGPEMLKTAMTDRLKDRVFSLDINREHFALSNEPRKTLEASYLDLHIRSNSVDYYNIGFAFHQTSQIKYHKKNYERLQVLTEMNRVLKPGGRAIISLMHNVKFSEDSKFKKTIERLGFKIVPDYSGEAIGGKNYKANFFTLEKVSDLPEYKDIGFSDTNKSESIAKLGDDLGRELLEGLEMNKITKEKNRPRDQRRMIKEVNIGGKTLEVILNDKDKRLLEEEIQSIKDGEELKKRYGTIANIPLSVIKEIGFERKLEVSNYFLLYKIIEGGGVIIIRGDYKKKDKAQVAE